MRKSNKTMRKSLKIIVVFSDFFMAEEISVFLQARREFLKITCFTPQKPILMRISLRDAAVAYARVLPQALSRRRFPLSILPIPC